MTITIDPNTLGYVDETGRSIRDAKDLTNIPACPVCGDPVEIDRVYATINERDRERNGDRYMLGRWECVNGCNPITRQRYHATRNLEGDANTFRLKCSCGTEIEAPMTEFRQTMALHPQGEYTDVAE